MIIVCILRHGRLFLAFSDSLGFIFMLIWFCCCVRIEKSTMIGLNSENSINIRQIALSFIHVLEQMNARSFDCSRMQRTHILQTWQNSTDILNGAKIIHVSKFHKINFNWLFIKPSWADAATARTHTHAHTDRQRASCNLVANSCVIQSFFYEMTIHALHVPICKRNKILL